MIKHNQNTDRTRILIVEDDEDDYVLACDYISDIEFLDTSLDRAESADTAIDKLAKSKFDLCLLDFQLGKTNGIDVLKRAKEMGLVVPIIMLTGQSDPVLDQAAMDMGAADFLVKSELSTERFARSIRYGLARKEVEQERTDRVKAETENKSKNKFLAHLSHELRTPLTAVLGYTELLMAKPEAEPLRDGLNVILRNSRHLLDLLNDVLDLSKITAGKLEIHPSKFNVGSFFADVYALMEIPALDKGLDLEIKSTTPIPEIIVADATRLRQVVINIISNAIKFTEVGKIEIILSTFVEGEAPRFRIDVKDTGIGIPKDKLNAIFQPFTQIEDVLSKSVGGSGLGLAICSELLQRMDGELTVTSSVGSGSCFTAMINPGDITEVGHSHLSFDNIDSGHYEVNENNKKLSGRVLVVDDLRDIRLLIGHQVEQTGAQISYASNGQEAITAVSKSERAGKLFDLVIMDIHMPVMNGREAMVTLKQDFPLLPVIAVTAASMKGVDAELIASGFSEVLSKPASSDAIYAAVSRYLQLAGSQLDDDICEAKSAESNSSEAEVVLIVEDDKDAAEAVALMLNTVNIQTVTAHCVENAISEFGKRSHWSYIFLDLHLGLEDGLEVARHVRSINQEVPIAILSGESPDRKSINDLDITEVVLKPIQLKSLLHLVQRSSIPT